jgi:intraflagellar transport protein 52
MAEGGEHKLNTNINAMLEQVGISVNNDSVIRKAFHKYLHPKEAYVSNGCLNQQLAKLAHNKHEGPGENKPGKYSKKYRDTKDDLANRDENGGVKFIYPYGATINVRKPSFPLLTTGPISFPANRPVCGFYMSPRRGKLLVMGSMQFLHDDYFQKEDNEKIQEALFRWLLLDEGSFEENMKKDPEISEYHHVPDITALSDKLRSCLQESDELPKDFTTLFNERLYKFDTDLIPEALQLYETLGVKHEPLTLIPPQFETPMPSLQAAVFPPTLKELPPPSLDLFDLDE